MSAAEDRGPHRLVAELADTPGAVAALVTLQHRGGGATIETLRQACENSIDIDDAVRWLTNVGLTRWSGESDPRVAVYELTEVGAALTRSLTNLAAAHANSDTDEPRPHCSK